MDHLRFALGQGEAVANAYPLLHERGFYEHQYAEGETEIINLCRSGWAGSQRYGAAIWSGDIASSFEALQAQVRAGLNMGLSGIPWWNSDIGGFHGGDPEAPAFRELLVRWFQYGVFCPIMRLHGHRQPIPSEGLAMFTGGPNGVWSFGDDVYAILTDLLFLRERLRLYIQEHMRLASEKGIPLMRPLFLDFPQDDVSWAVDDQFLFGPDLLVAPVLTEGERERQVYLPFGATWHDVWSGHAYSVAGLRAGDPDAVVGGPTIAYNTGFNSSFLAYLNSHNLPLDVDTFHFYGNAGSGMSTIASQLSSYPAFVTTGMSLDEFGSYPCCNYPVGGVQDHYEAAAQMLHDFNTILTMPALTSTSWAQFQDECAPGPGCYDPSIGIVSFDGHPKVTFKVVLQKLGRKEMEHKRPSSSVLGCHSKECGDQCDLASHIPFVHPLYLPLPDHIHDLVYSQRSPRRLEGEKAHPWLR